MAVVADEVIVELRAELTRYNQNVNLAVQKFDGAMGKIEARARATEAKTSNIFSNFGKGLLAGFVAGGSVAVVRAFRDMVAGADAFIDTSERLGIAVKPLQELRYAGRLVDVEFGELTQGLDFFSRSIGQASRGAGDLFDILKANKIDLRDTNGNVREANDLLLDYADLIKNAASEQERAVLIQRAFGRGGAEFANLFKNGAAGIREAAEEANRLGVVLDENLLKELGKLDDEFVKLEERMVTAFKHGAIAAVRMFDQLSGQFKQLGSDVDNFFANPNARNFFIALLGKGAVDSGPAADFLKGAGINVAPSAADTAKDVGAGFSGLASAGAARAAPASAGPATKVPDPEAARAAQKTTDELAKQVLTIKQRTEALQNEIAVVGLSTQEQEKRRAVLELTQQAEESLGHEVTPALAEQIDKLSDAYATQVGILEQVAEQQARIQEAAQASFDIVRQGLLDAISSGKSFREVMAGVLKQLADLALNNLITSLLGGVPKAGGGGLFNFLGTLFAGGFASGGTIPSGKVGIVGEKGPELAKGPMTVFPNVSSSAQGAGGERRVVIELVEGGLLRPIIREEAAGISVQVTSKSLRAHDEAQGRNRLTRG